MHLVSTRTKSLFEVHPSGRCEQAPVGVNLSYIHQEMYKYQGWSNEPFESLIEGGNFPLWTHARNTGKAARVLGQLPRNASEVLAVVGQAVGRQ